MKMETCENKSAKFIPHKGNVNPLSLTCHARADSEFKKEFYTGRQTWQFDYVVKNEIVN